jgi:hypothetical protein
VLIAASTAALHARRRQRALLLLAHGDPKIPGALVVDYRRGRVHLPGCAPVPDRGQRRRPGLLGRGELAAVLAHEQTHLRERHDLVLLPFTALRTPSPSPPPAPGAPAGGALLVEMLADDRAAQRPGARAGVRPGAVRHGQDMPGAAGALAVAEGRVAARVTRLLRPGRPLPAVAVMAVCLAAALLVAAPVTLLLVRVSVSRVLLPGP